VQDLLELVVLVDLVVVLLVVQALHPPVLLLPMQQQTLAVAVVEEVGNHRLGEVLLAVLVSSSSDIKSVNSQLKQQEELFLMLTVRLFIPLPHQRPLPSTILL